PAGRGPRSSGRDGLRPTARAGANSFPRTPRAHRGAGAAAWPSGSCPARARVILVSGLALGIDAAAHRGALNAGGVTVAVMGTGVDIVYPAAHSRLAGEILSAGGALVSQFPDGTVPRRQKFPARNWTMAALSDLVVVVEAGEGSGALITAEAALHLHKEVMAVPGSVFSALSVGTHALIRDGAGLVQNARDVLAVLAPGGEVLDDPLGAPE